MIKTEAQNKFLDITESDDKEMRQNMNLNPVKDRGLVEVPWYKKYFRNTSFKSCTLIITVK